MPTSVRVRAAVPGSRAAGAAEHPLDVGLAPGPVALRDLLDAVVRAEVASYAARAEERTFVRVLTERSLADALATGAVRTGDTGPVPPPDAGEAVTTAVAAFADGLFHVFVDDTQVEDLAEVVDLRADSRLLFLRLVPLAGG